MKAIWLQKIKELDEIIFKTELSKDGRLMQLYRKRMLLERAFGRCER